MRTARHNLSDQIKRLRDHYDNIATKLPEEAEEWHRELGRQAYNDLQDLTSGITSSATIRRYGHSFAKAPFKAGKKSKKSRRPLPSLPINKQSGRLHSGIWLQETLLIGHQSISIGSAAPYAKFILDPRGTKKMIGRGVMTGHLFSMTTPGEIEKRWRARKYIFNNRFRRGIRQQ